MHGEAGDQGKPYAHWQGGKQPKTKSPTDRGAKPKLSKRTRLPPVRRGDAEHAQKDLRHVGECLKKVVGKHPVQTDRAREKNLVRRGTCSEHRHGDQRVPPSTMLHARGSPRHGKPAERPRENPLRRRGTVEAVTIKTGRWFLRS